MSLRCKIFPDLIVAVKFAIDDSMNIAIGVMEWLLAFRIQVNNRETIVAEGLEDVVLVTCQVHVNGRVSCVPTLPLSLIHCPFESGPRCLIVSKLLFIVSASLARFPHSG